MKADEQPVADVPNRPTVAIDVDNTLILGGELNQTLVAWCRVQKSNGYRLMLWSMRGECYARRTAQKFGLVEMFDVITSKPRFVVDDTGWTWIRFTRAVPFEEIRNGENLSLHEP